MQYYSIHHTEETRTIVLHDFNDHGLDRWWSPQKPNLHDETMTLFVDDTRLVVSNDGWENMSTDLLTIHDYEWRREDLKERYATLEKTLGSKPHRREVLVGGTVYEGQPILMTEFGGIAFKKSDWEGWGYSGAEKKKTLLTSLLMS